MRRHWLGAGGAAGLLALLLAACSTTVAGVGSRAAGPAGGPVTASSSASASGSAPASAPPTAPSAPASLPAPSSASSPVPVSLDQARTELETRTGGQRDVVVPLPVGGATSFEAMTWDAVGGVRFWDYPGGWRPVGASSYPYATDLLADPPVGNGAVLTGMSDATFVLDGQFSGDGSANAVGYTTGPRGWGVIKALPDSGLAGSGQGVTFGGIGLENELDLVDGQLQTVECSTHIAFAYCGDENRVFKLWRWSGSEFVLVSRHGLTS